MTAFMSLLFALNIVSTTDYQKPRPAYNPMVVVEQRVKTNENRSNETEETQGNEGTETKEEDGEEVTPKEDTNTETDTNESKPQESVEDNTADENKPAEDEYSDLEVLETIDISATENDNVTLTLYAAPKQAESVSTEENEIAMFSMDYTENEMSVFAAEDNANVSFREETHETRDAGNYVTAVISGSGEMETDVYRHFIDTDKVIETTINLLAEEYGLTADQVRYDLPADVDRTDFFEVDQNINYYAEADCSRGPAGTWLPINDNVRASLNPADMLKYSPDAIEFKDNVTSVSDGAFLFCEALTEIEIPATVKRIGENAFGYCSGLTKVVLHEGLETIGAGAFIYCSNLEEIVLPSTVTAIDDDAFAFLKNPSRIVCPTEEIFNLVNNDYVVCLDNTSVVNAIENVQ